MLPACLIAANCRPAPLLLHPATHPPQPPPPPLLQECQREAELNGGAAAAAAKAKGAASAAARAPQPIAKDGRDVIYLGRGRTIKDDARKYPARNELTGGFAGGELGLAAFKDLGDVPIAEDGRGTKQPSSPLIIAFVLGLAATGGGLLLSTVEEVRMRA